MPEPQTLKHALHALLAERGIDLDSLPATTGEDPDPLGRQEHIRFALEYADQNIPARYREAVADDPALVAWVERLVAGSAIGAAGMLLRKGPSVLLLGATGVGKTHQAYGALRLLAQAGVRSRWVALPAADLYARLRPRHGVDSEAEFRLITDAPLLLLDDLGAAKSSEWVEEVNYRLVNARYEQELPTIFTSNVPPKALSVELGERVASRLVEMTTRIVLRGEDRRRAS